ncbi:MAG: VCBS repeat-containing protein, partial [Bacteroidota bacterium]
MKIHSLLLLALTPSALAQLAPPVLLTNNPGFGLYGDLVTGDFDGDGRDDLAFLTNEGVVVYDMQPDTTVSPGRLVLATSEPTADLRVFDVDGDGDLDLTLAIGTEGGWLRNSGGSFGPFETLVTGLYPVDLSLPGVTVDWSGDLQDRFMLVHANADPFPEAVYLARSPGGGSSYPVIVRPGTGPGIFGPERIVDNNTAPGGLLGLDLNGDGWTDIASYEVRGIHQSGSNMRVLLSDGSTPFPVAIPAPTLTFGDILEQPKFLDFADLDGDGLPDLFALEAHPAGGRYFWHRNVGGGQFAPETVIEQLQKLEKIHVTDLDADGLGDLVITSTSSRRVFWRRNLGGTWGARTSLGIATDRVVSSDLADIDGDGWDDLVLHNRQSDYTRCLNKANPANPGFRVPQFDASYNGPVLEITDRDGDLQPEITYIDDPRGFSAPGAQPSTGARVVRWTSNGAGSGTTEVLYRWDDSSFTEPSLGIGDLNGDGNVDFVNEDSGEIRLFLGRSDGGFDDPSLIQPTAAATGAPIDFWDDTVLADVDGDGILDLVGNGAS